MQALAIVVLAFVLFGVGDLLTRRLVDLDPKSRIPIAIGLGYGVIGQLLFFLAAIGHFRRRPVAALFLVAGLAALPSIGRLYSAIRSAVLPSVLLLIVGTLPPFYLALYPPVGYDATLYHLPFARLFATTGRLAIAETLRFPVFPQLGEIYFGAALLFGDDVVAQLTQWLAFLVAAGAILAIGAELGRPRAARAALALWLGIPLVLFLGANAYIDSTLTMCTTLAFYAWIVWRRTGRTAWLALAAVFCSMAAATKYHGLFFVVVLLISIAFTSPKKKRTRGVVAALLMVALFAAPYYVRIASVTGNPIFPYLGLIFGRNQYVTTIDQTVASALERPRQALELFVNLERRAVLLYMKADPPLSPWLVVFLPFLPAAFFVERRVRAVLIVAVGYAALVTPIAEARFLVPVLPIVVIAIGIAAEQTWTAIFGNRRRAAEALALAILLSSGLWWAGRMARDFGPLPRDADDRDLFIAARIPLYRALRFVEDTIPAYRRNGVYIVGAPQALYYCPGRCMGDWYGPYSLNLVTPNLGSPDELAAQMKRFDAQVVVVKTDDFNTELLKQSPYFTIAYETAGAEVLRINGAPR